MTFVAMNLLKEQGKLNDFQLSCYKVPRDSEELYDLVNDPYELNNLASDPTYLKILKEHRIAMEKWKKETDFKIPQKRTPDEFDRVNGNPLPVRIRPRPDKRWFIEIYGIQ